MREDRRLIRARASLNRLAISGWSAQVLYVANQLGVFGLLSSRGPLSAEAIANELETDRDATGRLLGALAAIELLEHEGDQFKNSIAAEAYLVPGRPESMVTWVELIGSWAKTFGRLGNSVRTGEPAEVPEEHLGVSPDYTRRFILGMHDYAMGPGRELARHLRLDGRSRLLDIGGGPGTYSMLLAERNPQLECVVFDLPEVVEIAREVIADHGLGDRVSTSAGDYHTDSFPAGFDTALISNVLHQEDWESCQRILAETYAALSPGGLVVVHAMFLNDRADGPLWPALHNLLMLLVYRGGRAYSAEQTFKMLTDAGFQNPELHRMSVFNAGSFVAATRP